MIDFGSKGRKKILLSTDKNNTYCVPEFHSSREVAI
jgi:hypothetical protein